MATKEAGDLNNQMHHMSAGRQVGQRSSVATVDARGNLSAIRTRATGCLRLRQHDNDPLGNRYVFNGKAWQIKQKCRSHVL
jgi:hypothetical protein